MHLTPPFFHFVCPYSCNAREGRAKALEDANLVELLSNMWMLCLLSSGMDPASVERRINAFRELAMLEDMFFSPSKRDTQW